MIGNSNILVSGQSSISGDRESQVYFQTWLIERNSQNFKQNTILRFKTAKGAQLGTIKDQISFMVSNLMDTGVYKFEGQILLTGNNNSNDKIKLRNDDEIFFENKIYILVCLNIHFYGLSI